MDYLYAARDQVSKIDGTWRAYNELSFITDLATAAALIDIAESLRTIARQGEKKED